MCANLLFIDHRRVKNMPILFISKPFVFTFNPIPQINIHTRNRIDKFIKDIDKITHCHCFNNQIKQTALHNFSICDAPWVYPILFLGHSRLDLDPTEIWKYQMHDKRKHTNLIFHFDKKFNCIIPATQFGCMAAFRIGQL